MQNDKPSSSLVSLDGPQARYGATERNSDVLRALRDPTNLDDSPSSDSHRLPKRARSDFPGRIRSLLFPSQQARELGRRSASARFHRRLSNWSENCSTSGTGGQLKQVRYNFWNVKYSYALCYLCKMVY